MSSSPSFPALPSPWTTAVDPSSGRTYYYHQQTGETSWSPPEEVTTKSKTVVAQAQSLLRQLEKPPQDLSPQQLEVEGISPGQIVDLSLIQQERGQETASYQPIEPNKLFATAERPQQETSRLDSRLHALYQELERIG